MRSLVSVLDSLERGVIALLAGAALVLACNAMLSRYLLPGLALDWTFEVIIFLVIWAVFLAAARLVTVSRGAWWAMPEALAASMCLPPMPTVWALLGLRECGTKR